MAIDQKKVAEKYERGDNLSEEESRFLQDRGIKVDNPQPVVFKMPGGGTVSNDPVAVLTNLQEQNEVDIDAIVEARVEQELARRAAAIAAEAQHESIVGQTPHTGTANPNQHPTGGTKATDDGDEGDEEGEEDYDEGWNNDERRAELAQRKLTTHGNKEELIARLIRDDNDELEDDDKAPDHPDK